MSSIRALTVCLFTLLLLPAISKAEVSTQRLPRVSFVGGQLRRASFAFNFGTCERQCRATTGCSGFTFRIQMLRCTLHRGSAQRRPDPTAESGVRIAVCSTDRDCDDSRFCSGVERCSPTAPGADVRGCARGRPPCPSGQCNETSRTCGRAGCAKPDRDGDGHASIECGGDDCDDNDPNRYPGNTERCDGKDNDCNPCTVGTRDEDGDGHISTMCSNPYVEPVPRCGPKVFVDTRGKRVIGRDCNDARRAIVPGSQQCESASVVKVCLGVQVRPMSPLDRNGFVRRTCPRPARCRAQPNGIGLCL